MGRHLKLGEIITQTHQVPKTNLFSYTNPDFPFINTHWLFEVLAYGFDQTVGVYPLLILKIITILAAVWLTLKLVPKKNEALLLPVGFIFLHVLRERLELRPEIFSFLFTATTYYILEKFVSESVIPAKARLAKRAGIHLTKIFNWIPAYAGMTKNVRILFLLPLIQLIWINTHIYFFVGLILQAIYLLNTGYQNLRSHTQSGKLRLLVGIFILSVLISLINPNGLNGLLFPLNVTKNYGYTIVENQTMFLLESINFRDPNFLFVKLSIGIILLSLFIVILSVAKNLLRMQVSNTFDALSAGKLRDPSLIVQDDRIGKVKNILISLFGLGLALLNVRSFPYLVFLSLPAILQNFGPIKSNALTKILAILFGTLLLLESYFYLNGDYYKYKDSQHQVGFQFAQSLKGGMDFVLANDLPVPIYNNFDIGSYILYRGYPKYQVFVDGRPEGYPAQFFTGIYIPSQSDYKPLTSSGTVLLTQNKNFKEVEKIYNFKTIIFSHTDQTPWGRNFLQNVIKDPDWKLVYIDDFILILIRKEILDEKQLKVVDLSQLNPNSYQFNNHLSYLRLGAFLLNNQNQNGVQFIQKALQIFPDSPFANSVMTPMTGLTNYQQKSQNKFFW